MSRQHDDIYDGQVIVLKSGPVPLIFRLITGILSLPLLAVGLVSIWNTFSGLASGSLSELSVSELAAGGLILVGFTAVPVALLYGAMMVKRKELRIDPATQTATLACRSILAEKRQVFPIQSLRPEVTFYPEDGDTFAKYAVSVRLPDRSRIEYSPVMLPLTEQRKFCEELVAKLETMISRNSGVA